MGIGYSTFKDWLNKFPAFQASLKDGKAPIDLEVENALLQRALGYQYEETITEIEQIPTFKTDENGAPIFKEIKHVRKVQKTALPDTTAQIFWLKNRRPDKWRDKPVSAGDSSTMEKLDAMLAEVKNYASHA